MKIDTEKMREAVLAECERICPLKIHHAAIECGHLVFGYVEDDGVQMEAWFLYVGIMATAPIPLYALAGEQAWLAAYRLLGLSERDAVAELREESDKYFTELKAERAKNAALVAALGEIKKPWYVFNFGKRASLKNTLEQYKTRCMAIQGIVSSALAANEKGGANG